MNDHSEKIHLLVRSRKKIIFDADVKAVTSINDKGIFDILPEHAHFISLIQKYILVHALDGKDQKIDLNTGVLKVEDNKINCYIDLITTTTETANTIPAFQAPAHSSQAQLPTAPQQKLDSNKSVNATSLS
jgi:F0F1-type ATP synthase epsilon subunit